MKFFLPQALNSVQAEVVYQALAASVAAPVNDIRIWKLSWRHNGMPITSEVGERLPSYFQTGTERVLAIFDCGNLFKICTSTRGVRGEPIVARKDELLQVAYFDRK